MTQKQNKITEPVDLAPVELDPPNPALTRWQELTDHDVNIVHSGDLTKVLPAPRPAWSDPDEDYIDVGGGSVYMSAPVRAALSLEQGLMVDDGETLKPARIAVRAFMGHMFGEDLHGIELSFVRAIKGKADGDDKPWMHTKMSLTVGEARELVEVVLAAVSLIGGEK